MAGRKDNLALSLGVLAYAVLMGIMLAVGAARGWNVDPVSGKWSFYTVMPKVSRNGEVLPLDPKNPDVQVDRFLPKPHVNNTQDQLTPGRQGVAASSSWYYWKLKPGEYNAGTRALVWCCYICHQMAIWLVIWKAQRSNHTYSSSLRWWNTASLAINAFFHLVHFGQTHWTYDATAQDVHEASSQGSVIMLLTMVLLMEYKDRGMICGWPAPGSKMRLPSSSVQLCRKYHGYAFAWGAIYTFWYHPMESTWGHAMGFFYTSIIMLQGSLMYTRAHLNRYWRFILETFVVVHATVVAFQTGKSASDPDDIQKGTRLWPMFFFGFLWVLVFTQIHGLPFLRDQPKRLWVRVAAICLYLGLVVGMYSWIPDSKGRLWTRLAQLEIVRIPLIEYLFAVLLALYLLALSGVARRCGCYNRRPPAVNAGSEGEAPKGGNMTLAVVGSLVCYAVMIAVSIAVQQASMQVDLIVMMSILVTVYILLGGFSIILLDNALGKTEDTRDQQKEEGGSGQSAKDKTVESQLESASNGGAAPAAVQLVSVDLKSNENAIEAR